MRRILTNTDFYNMRDCIGRKINRHLNGLDERRKHDKQKILELCQVGKLLCSYFDEFDIVKVSERPDFLISDGQVNIGLEHQLILDPKAKSKEGFYSNIFDKVENNLKLDDTLPNILLNLTIKEEADLTINNKLQITNQLTHILKTFVRTGQLIENSYIESARSMRHSRKSVNANYGAYWQKKIDKDLILKYIRKKDAKIESYAKNTGPIQWLVLVIGGLGESSYEAVDGELEFEIETRFEKVFLYEDFRNRLYELK